MPQSPLDPKTPAARSDRPLTIVVDAMGGDHAPRAPVVGAVRAVSGGAPGFDGRILLVGDQDRIRDLLGVTSARPEAIRRIEIVHASQVIEMNDSPSQALEKKKDASMLVGTRLVKEGRADALVSAGNTGALIGGSLLTLGRLPGIRRPAIAVLWPSIAGPPVLVLDSGANAECRAEYLLQFAHMGSVYMERVLGRRKPRVGLLNIGEEAGKGGNLMNSTFALLEQADLSFHGNVEPAEILKGRVDVVVTDGFVGNMVLKTGEAVAETIMHLIKSEVHKSMRGKVGALLMKPVFTALRKKVDHSEHGAAPLLGLQGVVLKSHGRADEKTLCNAVLAAATAVEKRMLEHISESIRSLPRSDPATEKARVG